MIYKVSSDIEDFTAKANYVKPRYFGEDFRKSYLAAIKRRTQKHQLKKKDVLKVLTAIFENVAEAFLERDAGVVMEGLGYFAYYRPTYRRFDTLYFKNGATAPPKYETKYYNYNPYLFTDVFPKNRLKGWSIEKAFGRTFIRASYRKHRYRLLLYKEVKKIYGFDKH